MPEWLVIMLCLCAISAMIVCVCVRANYPRTKEEAHERFMQDCREFDEYMRDRKH